MAEKHNGKQTKQRMQPYIVLQYLLKQSDENNVVSANAIVAFLQETCGIYAERRSIYKDIAEINEVIWMLENEADIFEAEEAIATDEFDEEKLIVYDKSKKGFYIRQRHFDLNDIRLLAECVYSAKFLSEPQAKRLANVVFEFVSENQAKIISTEAYLTDRTKTDNSGVIYNISTIKEAMAKKIDGEPHTPEKICFKYMEYSIVDLKQAAERRKGEWYIVSPYKLLINDGNYYLLGFDDKYHKMMTYRVDRMKKVGLTGEAREGEEAAAQIDIKSFAQRTFSMFSGKLQHVGIQFRSELLDTAVDKFGTKNVKYTKVDDEHFIVSADIDVSNQFFSWLCGFGKKVKIIAPQSVVKDFAAYLDKIREMY